MLGIAAADQLSFENTSHHNVPIFDLYLLVATPGKRFQHISCPSAYDPDFALWPSADDDIYFADSANHLQLDPAPDIDVLGTAET